MKKYIIIFIFVATSLLQFSVSAQIGSTCSNPDVIVSLPYSQTGMTTAGSGNDYDNSMACASDYMTGEDYVYSYTPATDMLISISLSGTGQFVGLFVIDSCPDISGAVCVAFNESILGNNLVQNVGLIGGHTYYIIIDTQDPILGIIPNPTTPFDIDIVEINPNDASCPAFISPILSSCNLGIDTVSVSLMNIGLVDIDSLIVAYSINGSTPIVDTIFTTIAIGATISHDFNILADLSATDSTYVISAWTELPNDGNLSNDTSMVSITHFASVSAFSYYQDFESGDGGWTEGGSNSSWELGTPAAPIINHANSGSNAWVTNLAGNYNTAESSYVTSPCMDFTALTVPVFSMDIWYENSGILDYASLQYSLDNGTTWTIIGSNGDPDNWYNNANGWSGNTGNWLTAKHKLINLAGLSGVQLRIAFTGSIVQVAEGFAFDNISIEEATDIDLGVIAITSPVTFCGLGQEPISVEIYNFGTSAVSNIPVSYNVNGGTWVNETYSDTLDADSTAIYTFTQTANLSLMMAYDIMTTTGYIGDTIHINDTSIVTVTNQNVIAAFPYYEDFESGDGGWLAAGTNSSFALGLPIATIINHAASGSNAWVSNLSGNANIFERSYVESPCLDFTNLVLPVFEMNLWYETQGLMDSVKVEYSIDSGNTWQNIGFINDWFNWYNVQDAWSGSSGNYIIVKHTLDNLGGLGNVKIRIRYIGGATPVEGVAFDDVRIYDSPGNDLGVTSIISPTTACGLGNETVTVMIRNYGVNTQSNFPVMFSINGGSSWVTENCNLTLNYFDESIFTFTATANMIAQGIYDVLVTTGLSSDEDYINDTASKTIYNSSISTYPYTQNFETNDGKYTTTDTSSWEWGEPSAPIINHAASGSKAWVTNLAGDHLPGENSSLISSCLDFSALTNPFIEFNIWYETTVFGGVYLEGSVDGGSTWATIGTSSDNNWYNGLLTTGFNGSSTNWILVEHALDNMAGQSNCILRFHFSGGLSWLGQVAEGVGIDDVHIFDCLLPQASFTYNVNGNSVSFTNTSSNGTSYLWDFGDGSTATTFNTSHTYAASGAYSVTLIVYNQCGEEQITYNINVLSIGEYKNDELIGCYPNPNNGVFTLQMDDASLTDFTLSICEMTGKIVYSEKVKTAANFLRNINLGQNAAGVYYLKINASDRNIVKKIIVE